MLVLSRKIGEKIIINDEIEVVIIDSNQSTVKLGINAPKSVRIFREELYKEIQSTNKTSNTASFDAFDELQSLLCDKKDSGDKKKQVLDELTTKLKHE